jgi:ankyrin repeat protein
MDIATTLLEYGAKANAESKAGFTPLHLSSQEGHTDMSTLLIEHQADANHKAKVLDIKPVPCHAILLNTRKRDNSLLNIRFPHWRL